LSTAGFGNTSAPSGSQAAQGGQDALVAHVPAASLNPTQVLMRFSRPVWTRAAESGAFGLAPVSYDVEKTAEGDLRQILPVVLAVIAVLLALLVGSLVAPGYLILSVLLS